MLTVGLVIGNRFGAVFKLALVRHPVQGPCPDAVGQRGLIVGVFILILVCLNCV
jgi:hypothetical protein